LSHLAVDRLACVRGDRLLFEGLSFSVPRSGALRVTGPNGAGKSSLLRMLAGLLHPAAGSIAKPERTAWLGHDNALKLDSTLAHELGFWARLDRAGEEACIAAARRFELDGLLDLDVLLLSNGQRRRAALARIAASGATLWLLDEPEVGLDRRSVTALEHAIADHRAAGGMVVVATHAALTLPDAAQLSLEIYAEAAMLSEAVNN